MPQMQGGFGGGQMQRPDGNTPPDNNGQIQPQGGNAAFEPLIAVGISVLVLALGLMFAFTYKRRK